MYNSYPIIAKPTNTPANGTTSTASRVRTGHEKTGKMGRSLLLIASLLFSVPTIAAPVAFDFNSVVLSGSAGNGLGATGGSGAIATSMNSALSAAGYTSSTVTVTGALATKTYNGEGHVVGETLGTSAGGVRNASGAKDTFIINDNFGLYGNRTDRFTLSFSNFLIYSVQFDWEIFPDANCPAKSACAKSGNTNHANWPDLSLLVDNGTAPVWEAVASTPNAYTVDPQGLGVSPVIKLNGAKSLTFVDWPAEIGIDYLRINGCVKTQPNCLSTQVPEPASLALLCLGLFGLGFSLRRK
jgi:hypothetical protein